MRADRLLSILLMLQTRGRMSARELAESLEVSTRTIYRDMESLSIAGVPVYGETGVKGGFQLLDSYRTTITGLNEAEVRALFMLNIPEPLAALGVAQELRSALLKMMAALPAQQREEIAPVQQRIFLDTTWWFQGEENISLLPAVQKAVWADRRLALQYRLPEGPNILCDQIVDAYGLVAKAGVWYLVYAHNGRFRAKRIAEMIQAVALDHCFTRDPTFNLRVFWQSWSEQYETDRPRFRVKVRVDPQIMAQLPHFLGRALQHHEAVFDEEDSWFQINLTFDYFEEARTKLLGMGGAIEVLEPQPLRLSMLDFAAQIQKVYRSQ